MRCVNDEHSIYLHSILRNIVKIDDMKVLNIKDKKFAHKNYLLLSKKYHPDKCKDIHSKELFVLITNSFHKINQKENKVFNDFDYNLFFKVITTPSKLTFDDKLRITHAIYKLFINKNEW